MGAQPPDSGDSWPGPAGWFGKIPALGDFASRRLPPDFIEAWDAWLSGEIAAARQALGPDWPASYLNSPTWRFALMPGVLDSTYWYGILAPSVDRVGRQFPLTFAASCKAPADGLSRWWAALVAVAARTAEPGCDAGALDQALVAATEGRDDAGPISVESGHEPAATLAVAAMGDSLWWPRRFGSGDFGAPSTFHGLPAGEQFLRLICL
jgi:type VI secretion system ImpM family protein